ncbi:uncharacterized protein LOC135468971 [Liolophura sinensis]|uniref:uncharacterized protein LOC135468971 n=1 Tax=Liolophura sinensis TaxID=3198878 RepID=UPI0031589E17
MDEDNTTQYNPQEQGATLGSLAGATSWLRSRTPVKTTVVTGPLLSAGFSKVSPLGLLSQLKKMEKQLGVRNSGTSVDGESLEFITPKRAPSQFAPVQPRSFTDGVLKRPKNIHTDDDIESLRESVSNLSEEIEKQKQATERLQGCVDLHQKFIKDLLYLDYKVTEQELIAKKLLEKSGEDSVLLDLSLLGLCSLLCRTIISWSPFHIIVTLIDKEHVKIWLNKCLRLLVSFCLFVLFKSWIRILGLGERVNQLEAMVYKVTRMLFLPFSQRTGTPAVRCRPQSPTLSRVKEDCISPVWKPDS